MDSNIFTKLNHMKCKVRFMTFEQLDLTFFFFYNDSVQAHPDVNISKKQFYNVRIILGNIT